MAKYHPVELDAASGQVRTIRLYGALGARFGRTHRMAVASAAEAVRALRSQFKDFERYMMTSKDRGVAYAVFYGKENIDVSQLHVPCGNNDIRIAPAIIGGKSGWARIIIGAVIVVVSMVIDAFTYGAFGAATGYATYQLGVAMMIGGVVQLLTPVPKGNSAQDRPENQPSYNFNGPVNTQAQGHCVPVLYGELIIGSAVVSAGISAVDQAYLPAQGGGGAGGGFADWANHIYQQWD